MINFCPHYPRPSADEGELFVPACRAAGRVAQEAGRALVGRSVVAAVRERNDMVDGRRLRMWHDSALVDALAADPTLPLVTFIDGAIRHTVTNDQSESSASAAVPVPAVLSSRLLLCRPIARGAEWTRCALPASVLVLTAARSANTHLNQPCDRLIFAAGAPSLTARRIPVLTGRAATPRYFRQCGALSRGRNTGIDLSTTDATASPLLTVRRGVLSSTYLAGARTSRGVHRFFSQERRKARHLGCRALPSLGDQPRASISVELPDELGHVLPRSPGLGAGHLVATLAAPRAGNAVREAQVGRPVRAVIVVQPSTHRPERVAAPRARVVGSVPCCCFTPGLGVRRAVAG